VSTRSSWEAAVEDFLVDRRGNNLSPSTIENYRWYLNGTRTRRFIAERSIKSPADFDKRQLQDLQNQLKEAGLSPRTVVTFHGILKTFVRDCISRGYGPNAEILDLKAPKLPKEEPETFTTEEEKRLLAALKGRPRDEMLVLFMLRTGLRLAEVCNVTLEDIIDTPQGAYVRVRQGKGGKDRAVPLDTPGERLSVKLARYTSRVRPKDTQQQALFLTHRRDGKDYVPLTPHGIQTLFRRLSAETGIHVNPHKFRHTFATRALSAGVDVMALQKALGHTTLAMVSKYVHYQKDDLLAAWGQRRD